MLDEVRGMVVFARVVESGSFAEAARRLKVSRAAVSQQVKQVEARLGARLLHRSTRSLSLTDVGTDYYQSCKRIAEEAISANQRVQSQKDEPVGRISVTCSANFGLKRIVPLLSDFRSLHPKVDLDVELTDEIVNMVEGGFDLAIRAGPLPNSEMMARKLCTTRRCICASSTYLQKNGTPRSPEDLSTHSWVTYSRHPAHLKLSKEGREYRLKVTGPVRTNNAAARLKFVVDGHGLGLLPIHEVTDLPGTDLTILLPDFNIAPLDLYAVYPPGATSTLKVRMLIDYLVNHL
ncbi:MAG: LysR family transcriptional regulator [Sneathiella sp.]|nr:LysR family transcriptional regulator [Sneathiella sp.]